MVFIWPFLAGGDQTVRLDATATPANRGRLQDTLEAEDVFHKTSTMMDQVRGIRDNGTTILLVEHNMRAVMGTCDRVVVLNYGEKIAEGSPEEIRENKDVIEAYLGVEADVT